MIERGGKSLEDREMYNFAKMQIASKKMLDPSVDLNSFKKVNSTYGDKTTIMRAIDQRNYSELRKISSFYYEVSGIYQRLCRYAAFLYRYDWYVIPNTLKKTTKELTDKAKGKIYDSFFEVVEFLDNSSLKQLCGDIALKVVRDGVYYGYLLDNQERIDIQALPPDYCRTRFFKGGEPTVEFNMKYFDDAFTDTAYRMQIINMFPKDFRKGYIKFKEQQLKAEYMGDSDGWYLLDPSRTVKFSFNNIESPMFINVIPAIIDLAEAQEIDRKRMMQQLVKLIIQELPLDKNGELIFDPDEAADLHSVVVDMLKRTVGTDLVTTFANMKAIDLSDRSSSTSIDELAKVERGIFNQSGVSNNLFNTEGNTSLDRSILNDEGSGRSLLLQFENFSNKGLRLRFPDKRKYGFKAEFLETTQYNYKDLAKLYKEQTQLGFSKVLPQIALGHTQMEVLQSITFENDILELSKIMIPPMMSSTMNAEALAQVHGDKKSVGGQELPDNEKSDKTLANKEAMG